MGYIFITLWSFKKWTKKKNAHRVHDVRTFGDNSAMRVVANEGEKKGGTSRILMMQAFQ
jgi:hypothetical protein